MKKSPADDAAKTTKVSERVITPLISGEDLPATPVIKSTNPEELVTGSKQTATHKLQGSTRVGSSRPNRGVNPKYDSEMYLGLQASENT